MEIKKRTDVLKEVERAYQNIRHIADMADVDFGRWRLGWGVENMRDTGRTGNRNCYRENEYIYGREARLMRIRQSRRRRAFKRRIRRVVLVLAAAFFLWIVLTGFSRMTVTKAPSYKYYTAVTVRCNDTLWDIAQEHWTEEYSSVKSYMKEIMEVNNMKTDAVYYGQKLILPYYSSEVK